MLQLVMKRIKISPRSLEETNEEANDKLMYATGKLSCSVQSLKFSLSKAGLNAFSYYSMNARKVYFMVKIQ